MILTNGEQVGEIKEQAAEGNFDYENGMANTLAVGAVIYKANEREDMLIVDVMVNHNIIMH